MTRRCAPPVLALLLAAACAGIASRPPASGRPWLELVSQNFVLVSDLDHRDAAQLVAKLEILRSAVRGALFADDRDPPGRVEVVAFSDPEEYRAFAPAHASAFYVRSPGSLPRIVLFGSLGSWQKVVVAHELTHHLAASLYLSLPRWLSEGLAAYSESLAGEEPGPQMVVGRAPAGRLPRPERRRIPARELLAWGEQPLDLDWRDHYAAAWLVVRHLMDRDPEALRDLLVRLARGEPPGAAFAAAFPRFDPARPGALESLDQEVAARIAAGRDFPGRVVVETAADTSFRVQRVPPAEVAALRIELWGFGPRKGDAALRAEVREALHHDATHPVAASVLARLDRTDPLPPARRSAETHPHDPRAWTFLAQALPARSAEREVAFRRAAELVPDNPAAIANLARELLDQGRVAEALPFALKAASLGPWNPLLVQGSAAALAAAGRCAEALTVQRRAIGLVTEAGAAVERAEMRRRLAEMERGCAGAGR